MPFENTASQNPESLDILVVDDEEGMREGMRRVLERSSFRVDTAEDGESALRRLGEKAYDLVLVDLKMPGIDGFKVTEIVNERYGPSTVVIIVSALATVEAAVEVTRHGAFDFLVKPFTPTDLLHVVDRAVRQRKLVLERERFLTELAGERSLSRQLINAMQEGVVVLNVARTPVLMNPRAEYLLKTAWREDLKLEDLGLSANVLEVMEELLESRECKPGAKVFRQLKGDVMLSVRLAPYTRNGQHCGAILILQDVSEEWKAEQDKNRFISMVAHELQSPMAAILNYINIILTGMFDAQITKIHEMLERCKIRGEALLELIRDLLYLNKREAGKVEKSIELVDLGEVLSSQIEFFRGQAERKRVSIELDLKTQRYPVLADRGDLDRIFMNLISNGIKYNREQGRLTLCLREENGTLAVSVEDTGIGMSPREMEGLFQEFYRVKNPKTSGISGTGLGLATVKRVVSECNGRIRVESSPGRGTTFTVTLPRAAPP